MLRQCTNNVGAFRSEVRNRLSEINPKAVYVNCDNQRRNQTGGRRGPSSPRKNLAGGMLIADDRINEVILNTVMVHGHRRGVARISSGGRSR